MGLLRESDGVVRNTGVAAAAVGDAADGFVVNCFSSNATACVNCSMRTSLVSSSAAHVAVT